MPLPKLAAADDSTPISPLSLTSADGTALTLGRVHVLVFARFDARPRSLRVITREHEGLRQTHQHKLIAMSRPLLERAFVRDAYGHHAFYANRELPGDGGRLVADVVTGFGSEGFVVYEPKASAYALSVDYYRRGVGGHGMGQVQIVHHDGAGKLRFESRPFVVMREHREFGLGVFEVPSP